MPPTTVRIHYRNEADLDRARQALGSTLGMGDRHLAGVAAEQATAELTGRMERAFVDYEDHWQALTELATGARGKRKQELLDRRNHMKASTQWCLRADFTRLYHDQFLNGKGMAGNARPLQKNEEGIVRRLINNEMEFAENALLDCETGEYKMGLEQRGRMYGAALGEAKGLGQLYADLSSGRYLRWRLGPGAAGGSDYPGAAFADCVDCLALSGESGLPGAGGRWGDGTYGARELASMAVTPGSGRLACCTHCHCFLEEVQRPDAPPHGKALHSWESIAPKAMTMLNRVTDPTKRKRLAELAEHWEHTTHIKRRGAVAEHEHLHQGK
jgi:hypothetical protein